MVTDSRESRLASAFVTLADTLVVGYDVVDLLHTLVETCAELVDAKAAGLLLSDGNGGLEVVASTSESSRLVELMQLSSGHGPCVECYGTGLVVEVEDIESSEKDWPDFRETALAQGFRSVHAVPMRLRGNVIGALNMFRSTPGFFTPSDSAIAQSLADVATIGILQERAIRESDIATAQLQHALDSRVVIEQAKGVISQVRDVDMDEAFRKLRSYARSHSLNLRDVAELVVNRTLTP
jgi:GAF domain-containing protein